MSESKTPDSVSMPPNASNPIPGPGRRKSSWPFTFLVTTILVPVVVATVLYQLDSFDPAPLPPHELSRQVIDVPTSNSRMLQGSELLGVGNLVGPEDIAYDHTSRVIYTGCADGWINRVTVNDSVADSVVEKWVNTGGRPLGIALGLHNELVVADPDKGLLNLTIDGKVELLTDEAEGQKFKLTDGVDVADDGMIYFTDASYKYSLNEAIWDILEAKPYGRVMSYDPLTKHTKVLVRDLYFPNGIVVSPDQNCVIFCETPMRRCRKYYIRGNEKGKVDNFIDNLPGMPDNIRYGEGHYWIALPMTPTLAWDLSLRYRFIRKALAIMVKFIGLGRMEKNSGVIAVDLEGNPIAHYYDHDLSVITSGIKIGNHLYCGSLGYPYIIRLNLKQYPANPTA